MSTVVRDPKSAGRPPKIPSDQLAELARMFADPQVSIKDMCEKFKVSRWAIYRMGYELVEKSCVPDRKRKSAPPIPDRINGA